MIIETHSRLHLTLIDLNGSRGRMDGGVGITIKDPQLVIKAQIRDQGIHVNFEDSNNLDSKLMDEYTQKIIKSALNTIQYFNLDGGFDFTVVKTYPAHSGLGSGTQLSLATAKLITELHQLELETNKMGQMVGRGGTSGIGVGAFSHGGFIVDGGHKIKEKTGFLPSSASNASPPPLIARYDFPEDWKLVLAIPDIKERISGSKEINIFQNYCPIPLREVETLSHIILMKMMPAVLEHDLDDFGEAINTIQNIGFKQIERKLQHKLISEICESMLEAGAAGAGMSSFGPTTYAITDNNPGEIIKAIEDTTENMNCYITQPQNSGSRCYNE
ncbi:MAG: hypothetical protein KKF16_08615 [Euryarchaeota archaeon]|nr:hypothetical protein [Euryarchaeota archaeon]MBV1728653.1 hypothetical protein [Methanobacterium sp.]MBU4547906.1 hypothetical protein [Euryarchaeota archaeon]MBU4608010.1 hypothetical protein [Euryarchaeota archaeon]MBV1754735.1 hypothetical protein [Methanobacterium sp.]